MDVKPYRPSVSDVRRTGVRRTNVEKITASQEEESRGEPSCTSWPSMTNSHYPKRSRRERGWCPLVEMDKLADEEFGEGLQFETIPRQQASTLRDGGFTLEKA